MKPSSSRLRAMIVDMDGVLWRGDQPIGDLPRIFATLKRRGIRVVLATNNATLSVAQYHQKLSRFGVYLEAEQVINSGEAAALFLQKRFPQGGPVFMLGESGLTQTLSEYGFYHAENDVLAVVVSLDRSLTYQKIYQASKLIRAGAPFIGTNSDPTYPSVDGPIPGTGAILAAIETATQIKPLIIGKPAPELYRMAIDRLGTLPRETLVVGDRLETDIAGGQA